MLLPALPQPAQPPPPCLSVVLLGRTRPKITFKIVVIVNFENRHRFNPKQVPLTLTIRTIESTTKPCPPPKLTRLLTTICRLSEVTILNNRKETLLTMGFGTDLTNVSSPLIKSKKMVNKVVFVRMQMSRMWATVKILTPLLQDAIGGLLMKLVTTEVALLLVKARPNLGLPKQPCLASLPRITTRFTRLATAINVTGVTSKTVF